MHKECERCSGVGFAWGGLLWRPALVRCVCGGGPLVLWLDPNGERGVSGMIPVQYVTECDWFSRRNGRN